MNKCVSNIMFFHLASIWALGVGEVLKFKVSSIYIIGIQSISRIYQRFKVKQRVHVPYTQPSRRLLDRPRPLRTIHLLQIRHRHPRLRRPPKHLHSISIPTKIQNRLTPQLIRRMRLRLRTLTHRPRLILVLPRRARIINQHHHAVALGGIERAADGGRLVFAFVVEVRGLLSFQQVPQVPLP